MKEPPFPELCIVWRLKVDTDTTHCLFRQLYHSVRTDNIGLDGSDFPAIWGIFIRASHTFQICGTEPMCSFR